MGDSTPFDLNQNTKVITLTDSDVLVHSSLEPDVLLKPPTSNVTMTTISNGDDVTITTETLKRLELLEGDRGDDTSTTSSGVSSGGSATLSHSSSSASPAKDPKSKFDDVSLTSWNIWQEDIEYAPASDSDDDEGISSRSGLRRYRSVECSMTESHKKRKGFGAFLRRFSLRGSAEVSAPRLSTPRTRAPAEVRIDTLPQYFVVKHLGWRRGTGLFGLKHVRGPVDELVAAVGALRRGEHLTLAQIHVSRKGVHLSAHADNTGPQLPGELVPLQFVSYAVQDVVHTRIFCLVLVRTVSRAAQQAEVHAFSCNCSATAKKLALSVKLAFDKYAASLQGKPQKLGVNLDKSDVKKDGVRTEFDA